MDDLKKLKAFTKSISFGYCSHEERTTIWNRISELEEIEKPKDDGLPPTILSGILDGFQ
jgi:hypothetical protein